MTKEQILVIVILFVILTSIQMTLNKIFLELKSIRMRMDQEKIDNHPDLHQ